MAYPGNPTLSREIRDRIVATFEQTVGLAEEGRLQEATLGCDFILKMDSEFRPAQQLQERLEAAEGPVSAADLAAGVDAESGGEPAAPPPPPPSAGTAGSAEGDAPGAGEAALADDSESAVPPGERPIGGADDGLAVPPELSESPAQTVQFSPEEVAELTGGEGLDSLFDSEPAAAASTETGGRIQELLDEGQAALEGGDPQAAIDAWSRIFLIDVDHAEANRRIEAARRQQAEAARQEDELLHDGVAALEQGETARARTLFEQLLKQNPQHLEAQDYLRRLDEGATGEEVLRGPAELGGGEGSEEVPLPASFEQVEGDLLPAIDGEGVPEDVGEESAVAPQLEGPKKPAFEGEARIAKANYSFLWIGAAVLLLIGAGGWFLFKNWGNLFPNATEPPPQVQQPSAIQEATRLHIAGDVEQAIARLERVPPVSPEHARAQELIAEWRAELDSVEEVDLEAEEAQRALAARREALIERGRREYEQREYLRAARAFAAANQLEPLNGPAADLFEDTKERLSPIAQQIDLYQQREWERILPTLWRRHLEDETNRDVTRLLVDSYFNLGIQALRAGRTQQAAEHFRQVMELEPDDLTNRLLLFSEKYQGSAQDLLYQILVSQLEYRT